MEHFLSLTSLKSLHINHNIISNMESGIFAGLQSIEGLYLHSQNNKLAELPFGIFDGITSLEILRINANPLQNVSDTLFRSLNSIKRIQMERIKLELIPDGLFSGLVNLTYLDLRFNEIKVITFDMFKDLVAMKTLLLTKNHILNIDGSIFNHMLYIQQLMLDDNPILCENGIIEINDLLNSKSAKGSGIICDSYQNLTHPDLTKQMFCASSLSVSLMSITTNVLFASSLVECSAMCNLDSHCNAFIYDHDSFNCSTLVVTQRTAVNEADNTPRSQLYELC